MDVEQIIILSYQIQQQQSALKVVDILLSLSYRTKYRYIHLFSHFKSNRTMTILKRRCCLAALFDYLLLNLVNSDWLQQNYQMQKKLQNASSVYMSEGDKKSLQVLQQNRKKIKKPKYKIQIINQDLQEAIKEVRQNIKDNPEWHLNVKAISSQYQNTNHKQSIINESLRKEETSYKQNQLPRSKKLQFPINLQINRMGKNSQFQKMKYTERQKKQFENRIREIKEKRMHIQVSLLEKQMKAKLQRKIQQNFRLKEQKKLIQDLQEKRQQSIRLKDVSILKKKQEESLLHESNFASVKMLRKYRSRSHKKEMTEHRSLSQQSSVQLKFKERQEDRLKYEQKEILLTRYKALRCSSQNSLRKRIQPRIIETSKSTRRILMIN